MKKLTLTLLVIMGSGLTYALPVGNPSEASLYTSGVFFASSCCNTSDPCYCWFDSWGVKMGFYGDYVFNRNLAIDGPGLGSGGVIDQTRINTNAGYLALNIGEKLDVFGTLGTSKFMIQTCDDVWVVAGNAQGVLMTETKFSWSAGARATLFHLGCFSIGAEGQYFRCDPDFSQFYTLNGGSTTSFNMNNKSSYQEWQAGLGLSYTVKTGCPNVSFVPYGAAKCGWVRWHTDNFAFVANGPLTTYTIFNMDAHKLWGFAIGMSFTLCDMLGATVEGRWGDEKAVYVNGQFRF